MFRRSGLSILFVAFLVSGCPSTPTIVTPTPQPVAPVPQPRAEEAIALAESGLDSSRVVKAVYSDTAVYLHNPTFTKPDQFIGRLIEIRAQGSPSKCPELAIGSSLELKPFSVDTVGGLPLEPPVPPDTVAELLISSDMKGKVGFLDYVSAELDAKSLYNVLLADEAVARIDTRKPEYKTAIDGFRSQNAALLNDSSLCWLYMVEGATLRTLMKKKFTETTAGVTGGAYGIRAEGRYFSSSLNYEKDKWFALSVSVLKRPSSPGKSPFPTARPDMAVAPSEKLQLMSVSDIQGWTK